MSNIKISLIEIPHEILESDLRNAINKSESSYSLNKHNLKNEDEIFENEMSDVINVIESHNSFQLLKRFILSGSLLPEGETKFPNSDNALNDFELRDCINFISGQMVNKFQGKLSEILAMGHLFELKEKLVSLNLIPPNTLIASGSHIRFLNKNSKAKELSKNKTHNTLGADAIAYNVLSNGKIQILFVAEIKSGYVSPSKLLYQWNHHISSLKNGVKIGDNLFSVDEIPFNRSSIKEDNSFIHRILIRPSNWTLTREYKIEIDAEGCRQIRMKPENYPITQPEFIQSKPHEWIIKLAWSYEALRMSAFVLALSYMGQIGIEISKNPNEKFRKDMSPIEAGENDFMLNLNIAIRRQESVNENFDVRQKTIELYNVLGFGFALGHNFKDEEGKICMLDNKHFYEGIKPDTFTTLSRYNLKH